MASLSRTLDVSIGVIRGALLKLQKNGKIVRIGQRQKGLWKVVDFDLFVTRHGDHAKFSNKPRATGDLSSHVGSCELMFVYVTLRLMLIRIKINIRWLFEINEHPSSGTSPLRSQGQN